MRLLPLATLFRALVLALLALPALAREDPVEFEPTETQADLSAKLADRLHRAHYLGRDIDDELSSQLFDRFLDDLDPTRSYLLEPDVEGFGVLYREELDDALRRGDLEPAYEIFERFHMRRLARLQSLADDDLVDLPFGEETVDLDRRDSEWFESNAELDAYWDKLLAAQVLNLELADRTREEAREILEERYDNLLHRASQITADDVFSIYMNALTSSYDPHTQYMAPRQAENFDMRMSLKLEGIGALLRPDGEFVRVERLVAAGPAEKGGDLQPGDRIMGVAQGDDGEVQDVVGWRIDDVVDLIRGPRGTVVRLVLLAADAPEGAPPRTISILRDEVKLDEQAARKEVVELDDDGRQLRIGVIELRAFYMDFAAYGRGDPDFKSSTRDVEKLLGELVDEDVDGVLLDLRGNGGGSLIEAYELSGLLLGRKPAVQVRHASGSVEKLRGERPAVYDGPLVVLVDRLSASASEIVSAAVQDHGRGVVVGERTFGKGTVQQVSPAIEGRLVVTVAKFYRVSGRSTQHRGVVPDILFPEVYDPEEIGESALPNALEWDRIQGLRADRGPMPPELIDELRVRHEERSAADPDFVRLKRELDLLWEARGDTTVSLDLDTRRQEQDEYEQRREDILAAWRIAKGYDDETGEADDEVADAADDGAETAADDEAAARPQRVDASRQAAVNILADLVALLQSDDVLVR